MADVNKDEFPSNTISERDGKPNKRKKPNVPVKDPKPTVKPEPKPEPKKVVNSISTTPKIRKETFLSKLSNTFFGDSTGNVAQYILMDVLIPAAKDTVQDIVTKGIEMLLFGQSSGRSRGRAKGHRGRTVVSYGNYYRGSGERASSARDTSIRSPGHRTRIRQVVYDYEEEAGEVLEMMLDLIEDYGQVSIADFYDISNLGSQSQFTDNGWGWYSLKGTKIVRTRDGFEIDFPEPRRLE